MGTVIEGSLRRRIEFMEEEARRRSTFMQQEADMLGRVADSLGETVEEALRRLLPHDPAFVAAKMGTSPASQPADQPVPSPEPPAPSVEPEGEAAEVVTPIPVVSDDGKRPPDDMEPGDSHE